MAALARLRDAWRRYRTPVSIVVLVSAGAFVGYRFHRDWPALREVLLQASLPRIAWSLIALLGALGLVATRWYLTLRALGAPAALGASLRIWFLSQAGRHLPGGIWSYVTRMSLAREVVPDRVAVTSMVNETLLRVASESVVALVALTLYPALQTGSIALTLGMAGILATCLVALHPATARRFSRLLTSPSVSLALEDLASIGMGRTLALLAYYVASVLATGLAFALLVSSLYPIHGDAIPVIVGALAAAVLIGFLAPIAPNGLGVREGVLSWLLSGIVPVPVALMLAVLSRAWLTVGEAIWIGMVLLWRRNERERPSLRRTGRE